MNAPNQDPAGRRFVASRVRSNTLWAGIAAALMLYFGWGEWLIPAKGALYETAARGLIYTLKVGGVLLAIAAAVCLSGLRIGLLLDGVLSAAIGVSLALTGIIMFAHGDSPGILYAIFAVLFIVAGHRALAEWRALRSARADWVLGLPVGQAGAEPSPSASPTQTSQAPPSNSLAGQLLRHRRSGEQTSDAPVAVTDDEQALPTSAGAAPPTEPPPPTAAPPAPPPPDAPEADLAARQDAPAPEPSRAPRKEQDQAEPPPEGYLAALASEDDEQDRDEDKDSSV